MRRPGIASLVLGLASAVLLLLVAGSTLGADAVRLASGLTAVMAGERVRLTEAEGASTVFVAAGGFTGTGAVPGAGLKTSAALTASGLGSTAFAGATVLAITGVAGLASSGVSPAALTGADGAAAAGAVLTDSTGLT